MIEQCPQVDAGLMSLSQAIAVIVVATLLRNLIRIATATFRIGRAALRGALAEVRRRPDSVVVPLRGRR